MTVHIVISAVKEKLSHGAITPQDLDEIEEALTVENHQVEAFCHSVHERCMAKSKLDLLIPPRTNAYGRIMVQPLEALFDQKNRRFSEKQLANYFHMISSIIGRETYEGYHDAMADLMREQIRDKGSEFTWEEFYAHPDVIKCRLQTLGAIAQAFDHFEQRLNWFINVMEGADPHVDEEVSTLQFTRRQARDFLLALFAECIETDNKQKERQEQILSERQRHCIAHLVSKLYQM